MGAQCDLLVGLSCLTAMLLAQVAADYQLEVRLVNYSNPSHVRSDGSLCDHGADTPCCDNVFTFQVDIGRGLDQLKQTQAYIDRDEIVFDSLLGPALKNPLIFQTGGPWQSNILLNVEVCDADPLEDKCQNIFEEEVTIELVRESTPLVVTNTTANGHTRTLQLSYHVVCSPDYYGTDCSVHCVPRNDPSGYYTCNQTDGSRICAQGKNCTTIERRDEEKDNESTSDIGLAIIAGAIGGTSVLIVLVLFIVTAVFSVRRKHKKKVTSSDQRDLRPVQGYDNPTYMHVPHNFTRAPLTSHEGSLGDNHIYVDDIAATTHSTFMTGTPGLAAAYSPHGPEADPTVSHTGR